VVAYDNWGLALRNQRKYVDAIEQYRYATAADPNEARAYLEWGIALAEQGRYREAIEITRRIIDFNADYAYAYHNIAHFLWKKADYKLAWRAWEQAIGVYAAGEESARKERNADFFRYYGAVLYEQIGDLKQAEKVLLEGLKIDPNNPEILALVGRVYTERDREPVPERGEDWAASYWEAHHYFARAEEELRRRLQRTTDGGSLQKLGELLLETESYDEARVHLKLASQLDPDDAWRCNDLGVVCSRLEDYHQAADYYSAALKRSPCDLTIWSNLAETHLKLKKPDRAEDEYRKILMIAADHIDSQVGLGEVYTAMADDGDPEFYEVALRHYDHAIELARSRSGSKRVARKELASMFYARGYAAVKAYEAQGALGREALLTGALRDFTICVRTDPEHYKGDRAKQKILDRRKAFTPDWFTRKLAPWFILVPSAMVLVEAQFAYYYRTTRIPVAEYGALTFGALMFFVVGLFLPQIQRLKGPGIELEKSPVNQITTSAGLGIRK